MKQRQGPMARVILERSSLGETGAVSRQEERSKITLLPWAFVYVLHGRYDPLYVKPMGTLYSSASTREVQSTCMSITWSFVYIYQD